MRRGLALAALALLLPAPAAASDPTPLFVLFIGFPAIFFAVVALLVAAGLPRAGLVLSLVLLAAHLPVVLWAADVGYMSSAGWPLYLSMALLAAALVVSVRRIAAREPESSAEPSSLDRPARSAGTAPPLAGQAAEEERAPVDARPPDREHERRRRDAVEQALEAFRRRDYPATVSLLAPFEAELDDTAGAKLEFARKKLGAAPG